MRILALTRYDRLGASSRLRFLALGPMLRNDGIDVRFAPLLDDDYVRRLYAGRRPALGGVVAAYGRRLHRLLADHGADLLWVEKEALPFAPAACELGLLRRTPFVLDFDDAWHERYAGSGNPLVRSFLSGKLERLVAASAATIVGNGVLARWAGLAGATLVHRMPTPVDLAGYPDRPPPSEGFRVGWIGTPSSADHLRLVAEPLARLARTGPLTLVTIGAAPIGLPGVPEEFHPWREETEGALLSGVHCGIMPLADTAFARGKSGYKLIQTMAAARPVVASPVGENLHLVEENRNGYLAADADAWVERLAHLRAHPTHAAALGAEGRARVEGRYSLEAVAPGLIATLRRAAQAKK